MQLDGKWPAHEYFQYITSPGCRVHFSQFGEDTMIFDFFRNRQNGFYVDVGSFDPCVYSNTFLLWKRLSWSGINIDADPRAVKKFQAARPNDINIHSGVGAAAGSLKFSVFEAGAINSFDPAIARTMVPKFGEPTLIEVQVRPLADILDQHIQNGRRIDYLNIDCEGLDREIVRTMNWQKYRPEVITVELNDIDPSHAYLDESVKHLRDVGYKLKSLFHITGLFHRI